ncbi:PA2169 family four-helix-bundle protein [Antarcticibacterium arcticum]|uniref:PA2169 family four-helix-bundle protein n=1 Tax=Antarcticibacterium arcticum TaxID=2585771 RepID=A0A5B8YG48_9FLAO|nr:PA2169 family four-helix-bundle protein [Antarcticibacterium arcticum]QED36920.1 PA2169 family four-helix-bundle protein [Antarcticibacterium arcticum]
MKTTREEAKENSHNELVENLQELLEKNLDAEKGFKNALDETKNVHLKQFFKKQAIQKNRFVTELDYVIRSLNEEPKEKGSTLGGLHRVWMDLKTSLSGDKDEAVLEEVIRGEKASEKEYEEKLKDHFFPVDIAELLNKQLAEIRLTLAKVKTLEDLADD